jgi:hypothetical protein
MALREELAAVRSDHSDKFDSLPAEILLLHKDALSRITAARTPDNSTGQKKADNCKMPEGVCFIKSSKTILNKHQILLNNADIDLFFNRTLKRTGLLRDFPQLSEGEQ